MITCSNGHENPETARFCGKCGEGVGSFPSQGGTAAPISDDPLAQPTYSDAVDNLDNSVQVPIDVLSDETDGPLDVSVPTNIPTDMTEPDEDTSASENDGDTNDSQDAAESSLTTEVLSDTSSPQDIAHDDMPLPPTGIATIQRSVAPSAISFGIAEMLSKIDEWSRNHRISIESDSYLNGLVEAANRRDDLTMWAALDPFTHLPYPQNAETNSTLLRRISSALLVSRNVLVFVPVALTWLSISKAVSGFGKYATFLQQKGSGTTANFLEFWQSSTHWWRIGHVAFLDFILITTIVILTLTQSALSSRVESRSSHGEKVAKQSRTSLAIDILKALQGKRQADPESITESLAVALNDLTQAARDVNEVAARLERASVGVESLAPQVQELNVRMEQLVTTFNSGLVGSMDQFAQSVRSLDKTVAGGVAKLFEETVIGVQEINEQLAKTGASIEFGTKQMRDDLDAIHARLGAVARGTR